MNEAFGDILPETAGPFGEGLERGALVLPRCDDCGRVHYYPRHICPHCHGCKLTWEEIEAVGRAFSVTTYRRGDKRITLAYFQHAENIVLLARILGETPNIGDILRLMPGSGSTPVVERLRLR